MEKNGFLKYSIGAQRVQRVCIPFRNYCEEQNIEGLVFTMSKHSSMYLNTMITLLFASVLLPYWKSLYVFCSALYLVKVLMILNGKPWLFRCLKCLQQVKLEYTLVKNKLETLFKVSKYN